MKVLSRLRNRPDHKDGAEHSRDNRTSPSNKTDGRTTIATAGKHGGTHNSAYTGERRGRAAVAPVGEVEIGPDMKRKHEDRMQRVVARNAKQQQKEKLKKKKSPLPDTWYYSSNHILVNRERALSGLTQLRRVRMLDDVARFHAQDMAEEQRLFHSVDSADALRRKLKSKFTGENVQRGSSIREMHKNMMNGGRKSKENILSMKFTEFGMGTAKGEDGRLYMVQCFRGEPNEQ